MMTDTEKKAERDKLFGMFTDEKTTIEDLFKYMEEFVNTHSDDDLYQGSPFYSTKYTPLDRIIGCLMYDEGRYLGKYKQLRWSDTSNGPYPQNVGKAPDDAINWYKNAPNTGIQKQEWPLKKATQIILGKLTDSGDLKFWEEVLGLSPVPTATPAPATPSKPPESAEGIIFDAIENSRTRKKCIVFTGAPGTGKTYCVEEYVKDVTGQDGKNGNPHPNWEFVQFHSSYDYTDFVEGLRPVKDENGNMVFRRMDGIFKAFCRRAAGKKEDFYFIIDEINRADLGRVFGELMYCFEKRGEEHRIAMQYANLDTYDEKGRIINDDDFQKGFYIPENVVIIGTMNDIDRSVETFDFALRRRFDWEEIEADAVMESTLIAMLEKRFERKEGRKPSDKEKKDLSDFVSKSGILPKIKAKEKVDKGEKDGLNGIIEKWPGLGREFKIGPAYFKDYDGDNLNHIWAHNIKPILREYMRGRQDAVDFINKCRDALGVSEETEGDPQ